MLTTEIRTAVDQVFDDMATERRRLDTAVDSAAEVERLKTGCKGRAARWVPPLHHGTGIAANCQVSKYLIVVSSRAGSSVQSP